MVSFAGKNSPFENLAILSLDIANPYKSVKSLTIID